MPGPLAGHRIIEIAGIGPGPFAAMLLSDLGAEVIRVERAGAVRGGAPDKPAGDISLRGRRNVAVDLKHPDGVATLLELVESADALIEGFRPGVMARLGVAYDVLPHESDILHLGFWARAFELLKEADAIRLETEGKNDGCWVMSLADSPEFADMEDPDKILVRSNGTVTYTGKDIAYQLWKLGLLTDSDGALHDFGYQAFATWEQAGPARPVRYVEGRHTLARTTSNRTQSISGHAFGNGRTVFNVIDVRQSYPQKVVKEAEGYHIGRVNRAQGDAARFKVLQAAYRKAPQVTRQRMYLETMQKILPRYGGKLILDSAADGVLPLLPMDTFKSLTAGAAAGNRPAQRTGGVQ